MKFLPAIVLLFYTLTATAQDTFTISGKVIDEQQQPVPFASIAIHAATDSTLVTGTVSNDKGEFAISTKPGDYFIKVTFLSYKETILPNIAISNSNLTIGTIVLKAEASMLKEVVIQGEKAQMELQLDKRVFNVSQDLSNVGLNAADILGNLPSINVDVDGTVSLRGSENVRILIDGRPSGLTSRDPDALRKLQGNMVERVEVITNPSSRYDAAGEVGIINIILKKDQQKGINGTFTANGGHPYLLGGSYSINFRRNKVNLFSSYGIDDRRTPGFGSSFQRYSSIDTSFVYQQYNDRSRGGLAHNIMAGVDYFLTEKSTLTGSFLFNPSFGINKSTNEYLDYDENGTLIKKVVRTEREEEDEETIEGTLSYKKDYEQKGRTLTADFKWIKGVDDEATDYTEGVPGGTLTLQRAVNNANETNWLVQADYIHPFSPTGKVEAGIKTASRIIRNEYSLEQFDGESENWSALPAFTNNMIYTERIHAIYMMASNTFNKVSLQGGLRGEYSDITTELTVTNEKNPRSYFNLFPSANLSYKLKENNTLQLSYSYRISRPDFRDLLPFSDFRDSRVFFVGNPNLKPEYTHAYEAGYLLDWENGSILSSVYYRHRTDVIQRIVTGVDSTGRTRVIPVNLAEENAYGVEMNFSLSIHNWWRINSSANFYRAITEGSYEDELLKSDTYTWTARATSRMTFFKSLDFQATFNYRGPRITTQGKNLAIYSVDLGLSRDILKGKGTIAASVRDLFNTRVRKNIVDTEGYYSSTRFQWQSRQFLLTFTYRLNQMKEKEREREHSEDEL
jgi:outer membrane receptor protein involved in Fe transport